MKKKSSILDAYKEKRDFQVTPEPPPGPVGPRRGPPRFMVHKHDARRLHYDLRLEMDDALASWAIPKGPSYDPKVRRLAIQTEDHPLAYGEFEGRIPEGEYGAGDSLIWDRGVYETVPPGQGSFMRKKGHVEFVLWGEKLKGRWHLVRTRAPGKTDKAQWILFKAKDEHASEIFDVVVERPESVKSGKRVTRGPIPAHVGAAPGDPVKMLIAVWPPLVPAGRPVKEAPPDFLLEAYGDGPRALAGVSRGRVALQSEKGRDLAAVNPVAVSALARLAVIEAAVDGELSLDGTRFVAHDLLWLDGADLRDRPLEERRELLAGILPPRDRRVSLAPQPADGSERALAAARRQGLTRLMAKRRQSRYASGPSRDWRPVETPKGSGPSRPLRRKKPH